MSIESDNESFNFSYDGKSKKNDLSGPINGRANTATVFINLPVLEPGKNKISRIKDLAIDIIDRNPNYDRDFLKIIPAKLAKKKVTNSSWDELDDRFALFMKKSEIEIKQHPQADKLDEFLKDVQNKICFSD